MAMTPKRFTVVGAGVGGLAVALRLAHRGHTVTVFEKNSFIGGRCHFVKRDGFTFDGGPTLLMMLEPFQDLYSGVGERFVAEVKIQGCYPSNRVFFGDGTQLDCTSNEFKMEPQIEALSGKKDAEAFKQLLSDLKAMYESSIPLFVKRNYDSIFDICSPAMVNSALKHGMLGNLDRMMKRRFKDQRLQTLFGLQSMYLGLCPWDAPSVYSVLTYMEFGQGIWYPAGGLNSIPRSIAKLATARGVKFKLNTEVVSMTGQSVTLASGDVIYSDAVICNADLPFAHKKMVSTPPPPKKENHRYSCSAYMMYIGYEGLLPKFAHHNIVLSPDYRKNLADVFEKKIPPVDPSFYVAISSKTEPAMAPEGCSNLFILVPCPNNDYAWDDASIAGLERSVFHRLEKEYEFDPRKVLFKQTRPPIFWEQAFHLDRGAAFGLSHDLFQSICFRPSNKSRTHPGLYYVGASTTPGNGLPMVLISAELVEKRLKEDGFI